MKIKYSAIAKIDLKEIFEYIKSDSPKYAKKEVDAIQYFIAKIKKIPLIRKPYEEVNGRTTRLAVYKNYLIIYTFASANTIEILTIHHHSRSFSRNPAITEDE